MPKRDKFLPLSVVQFHILASIAPGPCHGYGIMQTIDARSSGSVRVGAGTLYAALKRMLDDGLVSEAEPPQDANSTDDRRRYYALTALGREVLRADARRLEALVDYARAARILVRKPT